MDLKHGKRHPWLLSASQSFQLFSVLFACKLALLIIMVHEAGQNRDVLKSIAKAAEAAAVAKQTAAESLVNEKSSGSNLKISMPEGWKWRGCRVSDSGDSVEILLASSPTSLHTTE